MSGLLAVRLRDDLRPALRTVVELVGREASARGWPSAVVGGAVRDLLLGRPVRQVDLAVEGDAPAIAARLAERTGGRLLVHERFATATVTTPDGDAVDVTTARTETYRRPAALPEVAPSSLEKDLARRDFTINSMAALIGPERFGDLLDPHGGRDDLDPGLLRVLHPRSFEDDPTRAFRAARFASRLGFAIEAGTQASIRSAVDGGFVDQLSSDRRRRELEIFLCESTLSSAGASLEDAGLMPAIVPGRVPDRPDRFDGARAAGIDRMIAARTGIPALAREARLALFLWCAACTARAGGRIPDERAAAETAAHMGLAGVSNRILADLPRARAEIPARLRRAGGVPSRIRAALSGTDAAVAIGVAAAAPECAGAIAADLDRLRSVRPAIDGDDVLALGCPPGPAVGRVLAAVLEARLDGRVVGREEELALATGLIGGSGEPGGTGGSGGTDGTG